MQKFAVIIVASGSSRRMDSDKLLLNLNDKVVLQHSLDAFQHRDDVTQVIVVTPLDRWKKLKTTDKVQRVDGGKERHFSVNQGIQSLTSDITHVAVHDGARPLISSKQIDNVFAASVIHHAATSARKITDTVKRSSDDDYTASDVERENLWSMETPQVFKRGLLEKAYALILSNKLIVTDEVSALQHINQPTKLIHNRTPNPKITLPGDLEIASLLLKTPL